MHSYQIRKLDAADLPFAQQIRRIAGWNQTEADWRRLLDFGGEGCFLIQCDGRPAGTATTTVFAGQLGWIGMILVHPSFRGRGLATALVRHCLDYLLIQRSVPCVKLDATEQGRRLYGKLGFQLDYELGRWVGPMTIQPATAERASPPAAAVTLADPEAWLALDRTALGVDRGPFLRRLARESLRMVQVENHGYGMLREGAEASYLGPVVATRQWIGRQLVIDLLSRDQRSRPQGDSQHAGAAVYWDIPRDNTAAERLAEQLGFVRQRPLIRMWTGRVNLASDPAAQWAIAGPETG